MALPVRYKLVGLLTAGSTINYADRVNISVAAPVMMAALGWDEARFGLIFSPRPSRTTPQPAGPPLGLEGEGEKR